MAGDANGPSVIWVAGEAQGKSGLGETITISGFLPFSNAGLEADVEAYADAAVDTLRDELVASGIL